MEIATSVQLKVELNWAKHWAVGVHCAGAILKVGEGPSPTPRSPLGQSLQPLKKFYQASMLGRIDS